VERNAAELLDGRDPLAHFRDRFSRPDPDLIYLDGNSLGMLPLGSRKRLHEVVDTEWGAGLIRSWNAGWVDLSQRTGDLLGSTLLGASAGQVAICDSTTVNLYKLATSALDLRPDRRVIVSDLHNFPTDRYVLEGITAQRGLELRLVEFDELSGPTAGTLAAAMDDDIALVCLSHVDYRSAAIADMAAVNAVAHDHGALVLWDLCHSVGAVPVELDATNSDFAVGCTYKYLNAGPGAPAFVYVRRELLTRARQPIWGWFGQVDQFAMGLGYQPQPDIRRFLAGTSPVLGISLVEEGVRLLAEAGIDALRAKGVALTNLAIDLFDEWLAPLGFELASPRDAAIRGSHVSLAHPEAYRISRALIERENVITDFRGPDRLRIGPAPITTRFVDVWDAFARMRELVETGAHLEFGADRATVT
jgi:kynureninase